MVSTDEKIRTIDYLIKKYPEKKFLKDIRKMYTLKTDECVDVKLTDNENEPIINAHICKKIKD
jgi:hypothetical protein